MFRVCLGYVSFRHLAHLVCQFLAFFFRAWLDAKIAFPTMGLFSKLLKWGRSLSTSQFKEYFTYKPSKEKGGSQGEGGEVNAKFLCPNIE